MCAASVQTLRRQNAVIGGLSFALQVIIAISVEVGDDLSRGIFSQHGTVQGIDNARHIAAFEAAHGFFIEPAWQLFFLQTRHILVLTVTWVDMEHVMNGIYVLGHIFFTLAVALWVYVYRQRWFGLLRNMIILVNTFALIIYENFPVAPPRLTRGLIFDHHHFAFRDTVFGIVDAGGRVVGTQAGYNEFSAMPSVHMAWAIVAGAAVLVLARPLWAKAIGAIYPVLMLIAVVVTGNHYLLDVAAAVLIVMLAAVASVLIHRAWYSERRPHFDLSRLRRSAP